MDEHQVVFLIHGMGAHSETAPGEAPRSAWAEEPIAALEQVGARFEAVREAGLRELVEFVPITYDQLLHRRADTQAGQLDLLKQVLGGRFPTLESWLEERGEEPARSFFWTHVMDVILYRFSSDARAEVHAQVMETIASEIERAWDEHGYGSVRFTTIAHSLGTAVANGALTRLATVRHAGQDAYLAANFKALATHVAVANVSRVLWAGDADNFYDAVGLRPHSAGHGYTDRFLNVRHVADPFPAPRRFAPTCWGEGYREVLAYHVHEANVHGWGHYLRNPRVSIPILRRLLGGELITAREAVAARRAWSDYPSGLSEAQAQRLREAVLGLKENYAATFGRDGNLIGDALKAVLRSVDELFRASSVLLATGAL